MVDVLEKAPSVAKIVEEGGRIEIDVKGQTYYVEVKAGEKPSGTYRDFDWLHYAYVEKDMTMQEIADLFGKTPMTIYAWLKKHGIETRPRGRRE